MARGYRVVKFSGDPINLSEISRGTGISVTTLSRIFKGTRKPSLDKAKRIASHLQITLDDFITYLPAAPVDSAEEQAA